MAHARTADVAYPALPDVPEGILSALLIAADEILFDAILTKWSMPEPAPSWAAVERCRQAFEGFPWPAQVGGG